MSPKSTTGSFLVHFSAEGQDLADQFLGPGSGLQNLVQGVGRSGIRRQFHKGQLGEVGNRGQDVVEVVGDAAGKSAQGLHLLGLLEGGLHLFEVGNVPGVHHHAGDMAIVLMQG
jgi:hypothetical protein